MLKKQRILLLGPISPPVSGPGVKNKMLLEWLQKQSEFQVSKLNTYDFRKFKLAPAFKGLIAFLCAKKIILSVSKNGRFILIPICVILRKKIFLFPAGGSFDSEINDLSSLSRTIFLFFCNYVSATFVQTTHLQTGLKKLNFKSVVFLPNPRIKRNYKVSITANNDKFNIIFLSKIREGKGPLILIDAINEVKKRIDNLDLKLDFYGEIDPGFNSQFVNKLKENPFSSYKGVCEPEQVQQTISKYDLFVLPTFFPEGVPGAVIEAMFTGIPIIVSNYTAAQEMICDGVDGIVVPQKNIEPLVDAIVKVISDYEFRLRISENILIKSKEYDYDNLMLVVKKYLIS